ncbi:hypothetical protein K7640_21720 [Micromonospora sp. PLK6-60]|uniref:hypothetical protein n=1 Tax=Micromonospora sp. PLK6-60 TaxID=2873383 RepID=UPI001CA6F192|nr:hypothetical protein [Micromonospora sp. PLK6-60]MBY8874450.1 hypothetical protein [Micromonospora sp. PLK6-60]
MAEVTEAAAAAKIAMVEISVAAAVIPAAWPIAQIVYFNQCDPQTMITTGGTWLELSEQLGVTRDQLESAVGTITAEEWSGDDRAAFGKHIQAYDVQVIGTQVLAVTVGVTMICVGMVLFCLVVAYVVISTVLAAFAVFIVAAAATVVGAPAAASAEATANSFAASAGGVLRGIEAMAEAVAAGGAAAIAGAGAFDVGMQLGSGNTDVLKDLVQATVDGLDNVAAGFLSKWERDFVGYGIHSSARHAAGPPNGPGYLMYGGSTQVAPAGKDGDGDNVYGTGGVVDNLWGRVFGGDAWNH